MDFRGGHDSDRMMLWIDAVGGYWVCLDDAITIGQPGRVNPDVPILGDLAGCHARLRRDGEGFVIEAIRDVTVDGKPVRGLGWLRDGNEIRLGTSVRLRFRRPHALSGTVRLDFLSSHHTQPLTDGVVWMADSCILGPKRHSHIVCRDWAQEIILFRDAAQLYCRMPGAFEIDGVARSNTGPITKRSRIRGEGFSFNLEAIL